MSAKAAPPLLGRVVADFTLPATGHAAEVLEAAKAL